MGEEPRYKVPVPTIPWKKPTTKLSLLERTDVTDLQDISWEPFKQNFFKSQGIFIFRNDLKHDRYIEDSLVRALMVAEKRLKVENPEWNYPNKGDHLKRIEKMREWGNHDYRFELFIGSHPLYAKEQLPERYEKIIASFRKMGLGIAVVTTWAEEDDLSIMKNCIAFDVGTQEKPIEKYILINYLLF